MAGRPAYPMLNTNALPGGKRVIASPADSAHWQSPTLPDSAARKRPGSRGQSPPGKRARPGSSTPLNTAPPAPSIRTVKHIDGYASGTISSLLAIKERKQAQAANGALLRSPPSAVSNVSNNNVTLSQQIARLTAGNIRAQAEQKKFLERIKELESKDPDGLLKRIEQLESKDPDGLLKRIEQLESKDPDGLLRRIKELESKDPDGLLRRIKELESSSSSQRIAQLTADNIRAQADHKKLVKRIEELESKIDPESFKRLTQQVQKLQGTANKMHDVTEAQDIYKVKVDVLTRKVDTFSSRISTLETGLGQTVTYSVLKSELGSISRPSTDPSNSANLTALKNTVEEVKCFKDELQADKTALGNKIDANDQRLTNLEQNLETFADAQNIRLDKLEAHVDTKAEELELRLSSHDDQFRGLAAEVVVVKRGQEQQTKHVKLLDEQSTNFSLLQDQFRTDMNDLVETVNRIKQSAGSSSEDSGSMGIQDQVDDIISAVQSLLGQVQDEIKPDIVTLQDTIADVKTQHESSRNEVRDWRLQMENSIKASETSIQDLTRKVMSTSQIGGYPEGKIDILQSAITSLEDRYQNITTDVLHQQMVHWIAQMYPAAPDFLNQLKEMQREASSLKESVQRLETSISTETFERIAADLSIRSDLDVSIRSDLDVGIRSELGIVVKEVRRLTESVSNIKKSVRTLDTLSVSELRDLCFVYPQVVRYVYQLRQAVEDLNLNLAAGEFSFQFDDIEVPSAENPNPTTPEDESMIE